MLRALVIVTAFAASAIFFNTYPALNGDMHAYLPMAAEPFAFHSSPYSYRIAMPLMANILARATEFETSFAFASVHFAFALANGFLLARWLDLKGLSSNLSTAFVCVYYFTLPGVFQSASWGFVDASFHTFLLLGLIAIEMGRFGALCAIVFLGVFFKENIVLLAPYYAAHMWARDGFSPAVKRVICVFAASALPFIVLRTGVLFRNPPGSGAYGAFYRPEYFAGVLGYWGGPKQILGNVFSPYMTLWLVAAATVAHNWRKRTDEISLMVLAAAQIPFATDIDRMVITAFPAIYSLAGQFVAGLPMQARVVTLLMPVALQAAFWNGFYYREAVLIALAASAAIVSYRFLSPQPSHSSKPS